MVAKIIGNVNPQIQCACCAVYQLSDCSIPEDGTSLRKQWAPVVQPPFDESNAAKGLSSYFPVQSQLREGHF
jgi:hypothetical protein